MSILEYWSMIVAINVLGIVCINKDKSEGVIFAIGIVVVAVNTFFGLCVALVMSSQVEHEYTKYDGVVVIKDTHIILEKPDNKPFITNDMYILKNKDDLCYLKQWSTNYYNFTNIKYFVNVCPKNKELIK